MPTVRFPAAMKYYAENHSEIRVAASTVREAVEAVSERYPKLRVHVFDAEGKIRRHFNIFVNGEHVRELNGVDTVLNEEDKVILMATSAGGCAANI
ncbi:MAG: MoaD/ThiS family protein [Chloroflexota bacterium]